MKKIFPILFFAYLGYLVFTTSCANPGMPTGGAKDSIPPVVVRTIPDFNGRNFNGTEVSLTFDEFVISDQLREALVVSPPLAKRPMIRTKSKTLIIDLGDELKENQTYSLDFKDAIADNNEKNPLEDFRFSFSTGPDFDSLMIGGYVKDAKNLEPIEGAVVMLHSMQEVEAFKDSIPDYIATTDKEGFYVISNIAHGTYRLYALRDADNTMTYNQALEQIAFHDSLVIPQDLTLPDYESELNSEDTVSIKEKRRDALETPFFLMLFEEDFFDQYLDDYKRERANLVRFYFSESVSDSFQIELLQPTPVVDDWSILEYNATSDSLMLWVTDTVLMSSDTLQMKLSYQVADSLQNLVMTSDTLDLVYTKPEVTGRRRAKKENEDQPEPIPHIAFKHNLKSKGFDVYRDISLEAPEPLKSFDLAMVSLYQKVDTLEEARTFELWQDSLSARKYYIRYPWEFEEEYRLQVDSAAAYNYSGHPNNMLNQRFGIQEESYYAKIILNISGLVDYGIVQLLENTENEKVLQQLRIAEDSEIEFPFLKPDKYKIRLILDRNNNGVWDTGDLDEDIQPEQVMYFPKILKLRSNFEVREAWVLPMIQYEKELIDEDKEKEDAKNKRNNTQSQRAGSRGF
ncbi:Ig-like domain-containing protein [uncultured Sunxiuqinia sp.]|uniref:Ig-like domain-containing protein n=1 Tax=uncultured Sunxiuqinia sp. TaxID=1573825 RepID=UPI0030D82A61|tara:strand:- start:1984 stop:3867 length:1884 start_codon:yes stop_codon:yes gene_type:complete